jgi:hypothetical protein
VVLSLNSIQEGSVIPEGALDGEGGGNNGNVGDNAPTGNPAAQVGILIILAGAALIFARKRAKAL